MACAVLGAILVRPGGDSEARRSPALLGGILGFIALVRCGGISSPSSSAADGAVTGTGACATRESSEIHRCPGHVCSVTGVGEPLACTTESDCELDDAGVLYGGGCRNGVCHLDQCLTDDDCSPGTACSCLGDYSANGWYRNECVVAGCRTDGDCGPGGVCSPSLVYACNDVVLQGFYCHTPRDTCTSDADCGGDVTVASCQYLPAPRGDAGALPSDHWTCLPAQRCPSG